MNPAAPFPREIERRFLVAHPPAEGEALPGRAVEQGYLAASPAVRLRRVDDAEFFLTVKRGAGAVREEREITLTREQFSVLWPLTEGRRLRKIRRRIPWLDHVIELDAFSPPDAGLLIAEVEFSTEEAMRAFPVPAWFGREITGEVAYANVNLARS